VNVDLLLVGGGLANCLIAFRLAERRPDLRTMILEERHIFLRGTDPTGRSRRFCYPPKEKQHTTLAFP